MPTVVLLRHGQSSANAAGILAGWTPHISLNETGQRQAQAAAARITSVAPIVEVFTSPLRRCVETAQPLMSLLRQSKPAMRLHTHEGIAECRYGAWTGRSLKELSQEDLWDTVQSRPSRVTFPNSAQFPGESMQVMYDRAVSTVMDINQYVASQHGDDAVWCAVSHGDIIKAILAAALGVALDDFQRIVTSPASVSIIRYGAAAPTVLTMNNTGELPTVRPSTTMTAVGGDTGEAGDADVSARSAHSESH